MAISAVQEYVKFLLTGVTAPDFGPMNVAISAPQAATLDNPWLFVWGFHYKKYRTTFGRPNAKKWAEYDLYLWVKAMVDPNNVGREEVAFPILLRKIEATLEAVPLPVKLTDQDTLEQTYITMIGEEFTVDYPGPQDIDAQSYRLYEASIVANVKEEYVG